ncbi:MAG: polyprenyl synthetase family protein [Pirellulales bacterium]|nr:polyprenyl synthetase family protein [Pirellulales bacterium]
MALSTPSTSFAELSSATRVEIDRALASYCQFGPKCPVPLAEAIRYSLLAPGKRLRPLLCLWGAEAVGGVSKAAMPAACAVEMIHAYSLIHDDLPAMDDDDLRRGRPTCHKVYGEAVAILAGDALQALAFEIVARDLRPAHVAARCAALLAHAAGPCALVGGQADDLDPDRAATAGALESIHARKTGAMLSVSLQLGAVTAQCASDAEAALADYGRHLGLAFQIVDDLLDVSGDAATVGKRVGKDESRGKLTFPGVWGIAESRRRAAELIDAAIGAIEPLGATAQPLEALARYVLERDR